jgi:hypothetical protein
MARDLARLVRSDRVGGGTAANSDVRGGRTLAAALAVWKAEGGAPFHRRPSRRVRRPA